MADSQVVEDDEVHSGEVVGEPALPAVAGLGLEPVDEIDHVVEPSANTGSDAASSVDFNAFVQGTRIKGASRPRRRALPCRKVIVLPS